MFTELQLRQLEFCFFQAGRLAASLKGKGKLWPLHHVIRLSCICGGVFQSSCYHDIPDKLACLHPGHVTDIWFQPVWPRGKAPWFNWLDVSFDTIWLPDRVVLNT